MILFFIFTFYDRIEIGEDMKKILLTSYSLGLGGIEKALINLLNEIDYKEYQVTLILEHKEGMFLDSVPKEVEILEYKISTSKFVPWRKLYNRLKLIHWKRKLKKQFDFSASFTTSSIPGALLALAASSNTALWVHANYYILYEKNVEKMTEFFDGIKAYQFQNVVFVSKENEREVKEHYTKFKHTLVCNNFINGKEIEEKANEPIEFKRKEIPLFVNIGRQEESQKRLSRIIEASKKLVDDGYEFQILFIGDGPDSKKYKEKVKEYQLEDVILFLGKKKNPYPYYAISDAVILSSEYEGFPVVFLESLIINRPILSTKVSDYESLEGKSGLFCERSTEGVYSMMKDYLDNGFITKYPFHYQSYNKAIKKRFLELVEEGK